MALKGLDWQREEINACLMRVEAKAHSKELSSLDTCGAAPVNRKQIENALEEANTGLRRVSGSS